MDNIANLSLLIGKKKNFLHLQLSFLAGEQLQYIFLSTNCYKLNLEII